MKRPFLAMVLGLLCSLPTLALPVDSILVRIGPKSKVLFYGPTKEDLKKLENYDWNTILKDLNARLSETTKAEPRQHYIDLSGKSFLSDSSLRSVNSLVKVSHQQADQPVTKEKINQNLGFLKDNLTIRVGYTPFLRSQRNGMVNMFSSNTFSTFNYALGFSRYSAFYAHNRLSIGLRWGLEFDSKRFGWRDLIIDEKKETATAEELQNYITELTARYPDQAGFYKVEKSYDGYQLMSYYDRITTTMHSLNLSIVPTLRFYTKSGKRSFSLGLGGYAGYRIYMSNRYINHKAKWDQRMNSELNNPFQYGLITSFGYRKLGLYCHYQLGSPLKRTYVNTSALQMQSYPTRREPTGPISFGITYNGF